MTDPLSNDQPLINRLREIVEANLSKEEFDVEELAREAHMSRSAIHTRLRNAGKRNVSHFIREIRLHKAREMLHEGSLTAAEVAYKTGFGSPTYFSKCYHEYYGYPPGEEKKRQDPVEADQQNIAPGSFRNERASPNLSLAKRILKVSLLLLAIAIVTFLLFLKLSPERKAQDTSIIVLPFKNLTGNIDNQYFADGIMEDILNSLNRVSDLKVISRTTSEQFRNSELTSGEIFRSVDARYILEGSVRRQGNSVRITIQLIDGRSEHHVWSENYDRELTDMLGLQEEIARQVAVKLDALITDDRAGPSKELPTDNPKAWDNYLKARFLRNRANDIQRLDMSREGLLSSLKYYEMAIAEDSGFAEAYSGLANAWYTLSAWGFYKPYHDGIAHAVENFTRALELDPDCAEAHAIKGTWLAYPERRFEEAAAELETAIELNPHFATAHQAYAQVLMITGPLRLARKHVDLALELEPYFWVVHNLSAWIYYFEEESEKGIEACTVAHDLNPDFVDNYWLFALHYVRLGEGEKAAMVLYDMFKRYPSVSHLGEEVLDAYFQAGIDGIFQLLIDVNINRPVPIDGLTGNPFFLAWWCAIIGEREESIKWLEKTLEAPSKPMHYFNLIAANPDFDILRADPRFLAVIEKAGLARYNTRRPL